MARQAALEDQRKLEQEKLNLRFKEEELKLKTELNVSDAKTKVLNDLEKSAVDDMLSFKGARINENDTTVSDYQHLGFSQMTKELNKPKVEILKFAGNPMDYHRFIRQFDAKVIKNTDSYEEKMTYLFQFTSGEANNIATGFSH